jgi:ribosomal protein S13
METFLKGSIEEGRKIVSYITSKSTGCVKIPYDLESIVFALIISKYSKGNSIISFNSECDFRIEKKDNNKFLKFENNEIPLGKNSLITLLPISDEDLTLLISTIIASSIIERRILSEDEKQYISSSASLGAQIEKNIRLPGYKELPLFISLMNSIDPYIPGISGNRISALSVLKELNIHETAKLEELDEAKLNSLLYRIISSILKYNTKFSREDLISDRIFYMKYDTLEVAFALIYNFDVYGSVEIFKAINYPKYLDTIIDKFRIEFSKGYNIGNVEEKNSHYLVETSLKSPLIVYIILRQIQKIKGFKPIYIKIDDKVYTSRYFIGGTEEGLLKIDYKS